MNTQPTVTAPTATPAPTIIYFASEPDSVEPWTEIYADFASVVIDYIEGRACGDELKIWEQHSDGAMVDVTDMARADARQRFKDRRAELPAWMLTDDDRDEADRDSMLDAQHDRDERHSWEQV